MIVNGGRFRKKSGEWAGEGLLFHFKRLQQLLWPEKVWHKWNDLETQCFLDYRIIGELGAASTGKTNSAATNALADYYCFPSCTTVLVSSTTRESLEMRVWGEIKKFHKMAKERFDWLPGNLIEGRQRIVTDQRSESAEGRDFRNGLTGVACKKGQHFQGLGEYAGIKNKRLRLMADELHFMPRSFIDAIANLNKNPDFKCVGLGNPKDTTDALGALCEPSPQLGGWDGGIDQTPGTKTWETRYDKGICIQLIGTESPNLDGKLNAPLITQQMIDADIKVYGRESLQFTMMNEGRMPRGESSRRVITRQMCLKFGAMEPPVWKDENRTRIGFLDSALGGVGGDRNVFGELQFGQDVTGKTILALIETLLVPVEMKLGELPEDQITTFCMNQCKQRNIPPENFFFDSTGRGALMAAFGRLWSPQVQPVEFGGRASDRIVSDQIRTLCKDYYSKFVSELWFSVRLVILSGQFRGMTEEVMMEGCMREWQLVGANKTEVEPKEKTKLKVGRSPDLFDALVCGVEGARRRGFIIEKLVSADDEQRHAWKKGLRERQKTLRRSYTLNYSA
jgi:hypothetical protein